MWTDSLADTVAIVWVFDDLQFVLLLLVEKRVEGVGFQIDGFCYEGGKEHADFAHLLHIILVYLPEAGQELVIRPLIWTEHIVIQRLAFLPQLMGRTEVQLLSPVCLVGRDFIPKAIISQEAGLVQGSVSLTFSLVICPSIHIPHSSSQWPASPPREDQRT